MQQHLIGPVHRKAAERAAAEAAKAMHQNQYSQTAAAAVAAATWQGGGSSKPGFGAPVGAGRLLPPAAAVGAGSNQGTRQQQQQEQQQKPGNRQQQQRQQQQQQQKGVSSLPSLSHEEVMAQALQRNEPLTLDGKLRVFEGWAWMARLGSLRPESATTSSKNALGPCGYRTILDVGSFCPMLILFCNLDMCPVWMLSYRHGMFDISYRHGMFEISYRHGMFDISYRHGMLMYLCQYQWYHSITEYEVVGPDG